MKYKELENKTLVNNKNYQMAVFISLLIGIQGLVMAILALIKEKNFSVFGVSLSYSLFMLFTFIYIFIKKNLRLFYINATVMVIFLELNFLINGGSEGFGIIWITVIPLFSVYLCSFKFFFYLNGLCFFILFLAFWTPLNQFIYAFKPSFIARFPIVYALDFIFGAFLKYRITKTEIQLEEQSYILSQEIKMAAAMQKTFMHQNQTDFNGWTIEYKNIPQTGVSGDFVDFYSNENNLFGIGIFDVSGHGIASGMITLLAKNIIRSELLPSNQNIQSLSQVVENINNHFIKEKGDLQNYLTGILIKINNDSIEYVNAGHPSPILYRKESNTFEELLNSPESLGVIGLKDFPHEYIAMEESLKSGDELILFTDGIIERPNKKNEPFGEANLLKALKKSINLPLTNQIDTVINSVQDYSIGVPANDDITVLILKKK